MKKKIFFVMLETGGGHKSTANAIRDALEKYYPRKYDIRVMDFMKELGVVKLDKTLKDFWVFLLAHPALFNVGYEIQNATQNFSQRITKAMMLPFYDKIRKFLKKEKPNLIFSTHFLCSQAIDHVRKKYDIEVPLINMHTDIFAVFSLWVVPGVDYYIASSDYARERLIKRGIDRKKLYIIPFPLRNGFLDIKRTKKQIQKEAGIQKDKPTLLICFGGEGICNLDPYLDMLVKEDLKLNVLIITGKNKALKKELERKYRKYKGNLNFIIWGYATNMNELVFASDFVFIKPGPTMTFEAMALKKPIIFAKSDLHEKPNWEFAVNKNVGFFTKNKSRLLLEHVRNLMNKSFYKKTMSSYKKLNIKDGSRELADFAVKVVEKKI